MEKEMNILRKKCFLSLPDFFFQGKCKIKQSYNFSHTFISIKRKSTFCLVTFICTGSLTMVLAGFSLNKCLDMAQVQMKGAASFCLWLTKEKKNRHSLPLVSFSMESYFLPTSLWNQYFFYFFLVEECSFICPLIHFQSFEEMSTELR